MAVSAGSRLGPYEIVAPVGAGGMGEVYRARDTRLDRDVAVKVLPSAAAVDPDRLRRFEQEARATAALNHPNILAVYDVGAESGANFVVSELLEGETMRERLAAGPLPPRKAIEYAAQVARGLAAAHEKGIGHRDLKPDNLFLTRDGRVKILDFGIAKLTAPSGNLTLAPTVEQGTAPGVVLGTVGYMSPEQVRGLATDHRTDIFSFGAIVYEMLSGRRAFAGATSADTMTAILTADPPEVADPQRAIPPMLDRLVRRCLEKSPDERFQSARDLAFELDAISATSSGSGGTRAIESAPPRRSTRLTPALSALAVGVLLGAAAMWALARPARVPASPIRYQQITFRRGTITGAKFAADGDTIVYSAAWEGRPSELFVTHAGVLGDQALGMAGNLLAISQKGELALLSDVQQRANWIEVGTLARAPLGGGAPRKILREVSGADWSPDGSELAITRFVADRRRWQLEYPVGRVILDTDRWLEQPRVSRDGSRVLVLDHPASGDNRGRLIMVTRDRARSELSPEYSSIDGVAWAPSGAEAWFTAGDAGNQLHMFSVRPGSVVQPISPMPVSVIVEDTLASGRTLLQTSAIKVRTVVKTPADEKERDFGWLDYGILRDMSDDGRLVLFDEEGQGGGPNYSVFVRRTDGSPAVRLGEGYAFALSPDQQWVITASPTQFTRQLVLVPVGPGEPKKLPIPIENAPQAPTWFPDGKRLVIVGSEPGRPPRSFEYTIDAGRVRPLTAEGIVGTLVSPDGRSLIARQPDGTRVVLPIEGGTPRPVPGLDATDVVVRWSKDSRSLIVSGFAPPNSRTIVEVRLADANRRTIATISPSDIAGLRRIAPPITSGDGRTYAYRYTQMLSDLYVGDVR